MNKLSIVVPIFNEIGTVRTALDAIVGKQIPGWEIEVIVVESGSTDGTRDVVLGYREHPRVTLILEDRAYGKGHAVRAALARATGDVILIQDADLEYDLADYEVLLAPIVSGRQAFVLGSRHGQGGFAIRKFSDQPLQAFALNSAHWVFTILLNASLGIWLRDPFTMYKVFRRDCLAGLTFECDRFDFDWELLIKLVRRGYRPIEIPVSYRSRSFKDGKKVRIFRDPVSWMAALVKFRFSKRPPVWLTLFVCAAALFARRPDAWHNPQFWAEDGLFYQQAYAMGFHALFIPLLGSTYFAQKLIAELAVQFDPQWAPAIFMGCALALTLYVAARAQSARCPLAFPFACALAVVLVPDAFEVLLTCVNIQWVLASGMLLLLISADPRRRWQYLDDGVLAVMSGLTGPFSLLWAPLFVWRAWRRRTRASFVLAVILVACGGVQICIMWLHPFLQTPGSSTDYGSVLPAIGMRVTGSLLAGSFLPANPPLIVATLLGVVTLAGVAMLAVKQRVPERLWLGLAFALLLTVSLCRWRGALPEMCHPGFGARYFYPLQLIVIWLAFAWASAGKRAARLATVFAVWVLLANLPRLREPPMVDFHWKDFARHLRSGEAVVVPINPPGWTIELPARKPQ